MTENGSAPAPPDEDRTPTQSDEAPVKPAEQWVMPQPVFRRTDGFTPRALAGNEDPTITPDTVSTLEIDTADQSESSADANAAVPMIAEQPDLVAAGVEEPEAVAAAPIVKKKGGFLRLLLMILGITIIALVIGAVITGVVLWYFFQVNESQNLN